jgi:hypothetical protein
MKSMGVSFACLSLRGSEAFTRWVPPIQKPRMDTKRDRIRKRFYSCQFVRIRD